jgi:hypothetical protein
MKHLGTRWEVIEDEDRAESIYKAVEVLVSYEEAQSLHLWERRYVIDQVCYMILGNFSNDEYIVEELV